MVHRCSGSWGSTWQGSPVQLWLDLLEVRVRGLSSAVRCVVCGMCEGQCKLRCCSGSWDSTVQLEVREGAVATVLRVRFDLADRAPHAHIVD
jgi:hypothetical protein